MRTLLKKPVVIFWIVFVLISILLLLTKGLDYGVDFSGGTAFQIILEESVGNEELSKTANIISKRLDWSGSKDAKVTPSGSQYITAQIAESSPEEISHLKENILKQGKFEAVLDGNTLFSGGEIRSISKNPQDGYGIRVADKQSNTYQWVLPFVLSPDASQRFAEMVFHQCSPMGFTSGSAEYDCKKTYFFVDRPKDFVILVDKETYVEEKKVPSTLDLDTGEYIAFEEILNQVNTSYYITDSNTLDSNIISGLKEDFNSYKKVIISPNISDNIKQELRDIGYKIKLVEKFENKPWIWDASGLKSVISLTEGIANMDAPTIDSPMFDTFTKLTIQGSANSQENANQRLDNLLLILESGSLPIPIESISTESISPYLGDDFLNNSLLIGLLALLTVAIVLFIRYKHLSLSLPMLITGASEIFILLGVLSLLNFRLDLAAVAGILATIGTGMDDIIIITDELIKGKKQEHVSSLKQKIKKAFFIVFAAAATAAATMLPIIFYRPALGKLVGFAITILLGTVIGIIITRPLYAQIARRILSKK